MQKCFFLIIAGLALMFTQPLAAQKEGAIWYFGQNAGLDFNDYFPKPLTDGKINTREGVATICDKDGNLLFYTDGQTVYNRIHHVMENGEGLLGDKSSTQSSIVVPMPGSETRYYLFTVDQAGTPDNPGDGLNYSIVDLSRNFGLGSLVELNRPLPDVSGILFTEKITVVKHSDKKSYWIIAHEFGSNRFYEFLLTENGLRSYGAIAAGSEHRLDPTDRNNRGATGYLKSSPKGEFLVTAVEGMHFFELFSFKNTTGDIQLIVKLPAGNRQYPTRDSCAAYGVEFSPTSNFLYGSTRKGGLLYQWSLAQLNATSILNSMRILREDPGSLCGALQLAYNGKIYVSLGGQPYLGVISSPIQEDCHYREQGASLVDNSTVKGGKAYFGLPTFLSDFFKAAEFYYENTCQNDITRFYLSTRLAIEGLPSWRIYSENAMEIVGDAEVDPITNEGTFRFTQPGKYLVELKVNQFGTLLTQRREITIHSLPPLNLPDSSSLCKGSPARLDAGDGAFYSWRDNPNLNVERYRNIYKEGKYVVTVTHYNGCSNTDSTMVVEKPLPVIRDTSIVFAACGSKTGSISLEMEQPLDQYTFEWTQIPGNATNQAFNLGVGVYEVKVTSVTTGCTLISKLSLSENDAPEVKIRPSVSGQICPGTKVSLRAEGAAQYLWIDPEGLTSSFIEVTPWETTTYHVKGYSFDQTTGDTCSALGDVTIKVFPYARPQLGADREGCQGRTITLDGGSDYDAWRWSTNENTQVVNITESVKELILYATDKNRCILTDTIGILIKPLPEINLGSDSIVRCQGKPIELFGGTGDSVLWSSGETTPRILVNQSDTYKLSIWKNGCASQDSVQVTVKPLPEVSLNLPRDTIMCLPDSIKLYGGKGDSYYWNTGEETAEKYVSRSGQFILTITYDGCPNSDTVNLTAKPLPSVYLGRDTVYCKSDNIQLFGDDGTADDYLWNNGAKSPRLTISESGEYALTVQKNGCTNSDTVAIRVNDPAQLVIDEVHPTPVSCPGNRDGSLEIIAHGSGISYDYSIDGGLNYFSDRLFTGLYGDKTFHVVVREDKACTVEYPQEIKFREPDSMRISYHLVSPSCETCPDGEINLSIAGGTPPYSVKWSTNDTITFLSNMALGKYLVWVTDAMKCRDNALVDLTLDYPPFEIPNAFTPNGDGFNEKWEVAAFRDFPGCLVKIFDRSGKLVWWSDPGYPVPWGGVDQSGSALPVGAYYYLVWLRSELKPLKGSVSILR